MDKTFEKIGYVTEWDGKFWTDEGERGCDYRADIRKAKFIPEDEIKYCQGLPEFQTHRGNITDTEKLRKGKFVKIKITTNYAEIF